MFSWFSTKRNTNVGQFPLKRPQEDNQPPLFELSQTSTSDATEVLLGRSDHQRLSYFPSIMNLRLKGLARYTRVSEIRTTTTISLYKNSSRLCRLAVLP
ncbi:hypothetical protein AVEN_145176-1 [Araneus ventricosus]|uniref:Uncharacterized protein n=1 Tax=Araneus ventricosus TaxID=182803 RepID=A0A4Y2M0L6_ARAVE|nr:hypothetical protein AVEN_71271-1 [Araneus ventricosus]GBN20578.1 hypothetical protein AVEN_145176-1 [Araneus ventricosus]